MTEARWARPASNDLAAIGEYWEERANKERAALIMQSILEAADELVAFPSLGHKRQEATHTNMLFWNVDPYVIAFRREPDVYILRVVHGARNFTKIF